jgi:hypothetical protein
VEEDVRPAFPGDGATPFFERARTILGARLEAIPSANVRAVGDARFLWEGATRASDLGGLSDRARLDPYRLEADALFVERNHLVRTGWIRFGRQTVRWGSGLVFNPTSTIGPVDLEDPLRFGQPMGTEMARASLPLGPLRVEAVGVPLFRPAFLPPIDSRTALARSGDPAAEAIARDPTWTIDVTASDPPLDGELGNAQGALRLSGTVPWIDLELAGSAYVGRTPLPAIGSADLTADLVAKTLTGNVTLVHPRLAVYGLDGNLQIPAGPLGAIGAWSEGAWVVPVPYTQTLTANGSTSTSRALEKAYYRGTTGLDHTSDSGLYVAVEYLRGFLDELGAGAQHDYAFAIVQRPFFRERLTARFFGGLSLDDHSLLAAPELAWSAGDSLQLSLGGYAGLGDEPKKFARANIGPPLAVVRARLSF